MRKLEEIKGDEALDVTADVFDDITKLFADEKIKEMKDKGKNMASILAFAIKKKKSVVIHLLSTLAGVSPKEYAENMTLASLLHDADDLMGDPLVKELFTLQGQNVVKDNSGSVTGDTQADE